MAKITIPDITGNRTTTAALNSRMTQIEDELNQKVLYRDNPEGEPNEMSNDIDMNTLYKLINLADGVDLTDSVNMRQLKEYSGGTNPVYAPIQVTDGVAVSYSAPGISSSVSEHYFVFIGGTYQDPQEYTIEDGGATITFSEAPPAGQDLVVIGYQPTLKVIDGNFLQHAIKEYQVLSAPVSGVQEVTFVANPEQGVLYVSGPYVDGTMLRQDEDYSLSAGNKVRMKKRTFPAGTVVALAAPAAIDPVTPEFIDRVVQEILNQGNTGVDIGHIAVGGDVYPDISAGLAGTSDGEYFVIIGEDGSITIYRNDGGVATPITIYPSLEQLAQSAFFTRDTDAEMLADSPAAEVYYVVGGKTAIGDGLGDIYVVKDTDDSGEGLAFANGKFAIRMRTSPQITSASSVDDPFPSDPRDGDLHVILETDQSTEGRVIGVLSTSTGGVFGSGNPGSGGTSVATSGNVSLEAGASYIFDILIDMNPDYPPDGGLQSFSVDVNLTGDLTNNVAVFQFWRDGAIYKGSGSVAHYEAQHMAGSVVFTAPDASSVSFEGVRVTNNVLISSLTVKVTRL